MRLYFLVPWNVCVKQKQAAALRFIGYGTGTRICGCTKENNGGTATKNILQTKILQASK